jgi:hypothetical protein
MTRARISDLLNVNPRFFRSVNLERDFGDALALDGYVATAETERHLRRIGRSLRPESGERAWRITGDFGSGKSSFALVLANLLSRPAKELPKNIQPLCKVLGQDSKGPHLLPVLVTGAREPLAFAVLRSLHAAMNRQIDGRKKLLTKAKIDAVLAAGTVTDRDAVACLEEIANELVTKGLFDGILLIIDELGKALEFAALHPEKQDIYFLQTLAESSSRSAAAPIYTLGLLHQGFTEYAQKLPSTAQLEWAKVSERYSEIPFNQPLGQVSTLIASALSLEDDGTTLWGWKGKTKEDMAAAVDLGMFGPSPGKTHLVDTAPALYPLHPTVIPVLARFFRRFGQNERSLFSFLLSSEPYALQDFATNEASPATVFRLSDFYDYAANNFAHRLSGQSFRSHWNHIDARIRASENESPEIQALLKTIGILNVVSSPELYPSEELLRLTLGETENLEKNLRSLTKRGLIFNRGRAGYSLWPHASVNLEQRFQEACEKHTRASRIASVIREKLDARPLVARRHYIRTGNLRHFDVRFLAAAEFTDGAATLRATPPADGLITVVLCESASEQALAIKSAQSPKARDPHLLVAISAPLDVLSVNALELERWEWVERNTPELKDDKYAAEEVSRQISAFRQLLENKLQELVGFRGDAGTSQITWFHQGVEQSAIGHEKNLQSFLSNLCNELFDQAPQVRNELVNRQSISSAAAAARQRIFDGMLNHGDKELLGLPADRYPPEKSLYLSLLAAGGLHQNEGDKWSIAFPTEANDPLNLRPALTAILRMLEEVPDRRVPVSEIQEILRSRPYGVRDGLIPILLLAVFVVHETEIAIYEDNVFQPDVEEFMMMRLARRPETFEFQLYRISGVRKALITELASVVDADRAESSQLLSIVRPLYMFLAGLPDYCRQTDQLSKETLALRKAIDAAREPADLVFSEIPKALGFNPNAKADIKPSALAAKLGESITELRRCFPELHNRMASAILQSFRHDGTLESWRISIAELAETILVGLGDPEFRAFCIKLTDAENPEPEWLEALGSLLTRCPPSRWKDRDETVFRERIEAFARQFERVLATCFTREGVLPETAIRVAVTPRSGVEKDLVISLSPNQATEADALLKKIRQLLPKDQPNISLAALSRLLWDNIQKPE